MSNYTFENFQRFQRSGVTEEDVKILKAETVRDAFLDVRDDMHALVKELAPGIKEGRWTSILGDDVSGRLVALMIQDVTSRYAGEHKQKGPETYFFAGGQTALPPDAATWSSEEIAAKSQERRMNLERYIDQLKDKLGSRVLLVTEQIRLGSTIKQIGKILKEQGIDFDIATMWSANSAALHEMELVDADPETFEHVTLYSGQENAGASDPFSSDVSTVFYELGSVLKEATGVQKTGMHPVTEINTEADRDLIKLARDEVSKLSNELYQDIINS